MFTILLIILTVPRTGTNFLTLFVRQNGSISFLHNGQRYNDKHGYPNSAQPTALLPLPPAQPVALLPLLPMFSLQLTDCPGHCMLESECVYDSLLDMFVASFVKIILSIYLTSAAYIHTVQNNQFMSSGDSKTYIFQLKLNNLLFITLL